MRQRLLRFALVALLLVGALGIALFVGLGHERPAGTPGDEAEARVDRMWAAVDADAWARTRALRFTFAGRFAHLWDRDRGVAEVVSGDRRALVRTGDGTGVAFEGGERLEGDAAREALAWGYAHWVNDSFWLNPVVKARDEGTSRSAVDLEDGREAVLVAYASGGLTPGDAYLWILGEGGLPSAWRMHVSVLPIDGLETTWTGWTTLSTGARVSRVHGMGPLETELIGSPEGATTLRGLLGEGVADPFAPLFE